MPVDPVGDLDALVAEPPGDLRDRDAVGQGVGCVAVPQGVRDELLRQSCPLDGQTVLKDRVRRPAYLLPDPASRTAYEPGEVAQCDLWFPPARGAGSRPGHGACGGHRPARDPRSDQSMIPWSPTDRHPRQGQPPEAVAEVTRSQPRCHWNRFQPGLSGEFASSSQADLMVARGTASTWPLTIH